MNTTKLARVVTEVFAPAVLVTIELFHPAGFTRTAGNPNAPGMYEYLHKHEIYDPAFKALVPSLFEGRSRPVFVLDCWRYLRDTLSTIPYVRYRAVGVASE